MSKLMKFIFEPLLTVKVTLVHKSRVSMQIYFILACRCLLNKALRKIPLAILHGQLNWKTIRAGTSLMLGKSPGLESNTEGTEQTKILILMEAINYYSKGFDGHYETKII